MKHTVLEFARRAGLSINTQTIRVALVTMTLVLFVLSAGAPSVIGGGGI